MFEFKLPAGITSWNSYYILMVKDPNGDTILTKIVWVQYQVSCAGFVPTSQFTIVTKVGDYRKIFFSDFLEPSDCSAEFTATLNEADSALELFDDHALVWVDDPERHYSYT